MFQASFLHPNQSLPAKFKVPGIEVPNFIRIPRSGHVTFFFMIMK
jgi:hypothetical protein